MKISTYVEAKTGVIYLSVLWNRTTRFMVSTGLHSEKKFAGTEVPGSCAKSRRLRELLNEVEDYMAEHPREKPGELKKHLKVIVEGGVIEPPQFADYMREYGENAKTAGTRETYSRAVAKVDQFAPKCGLADIDRRWLDRFTAWLRGEGLRDNTVSIYLRCVRSVWNWCIDEGLTDRYPFHRFKIPHEKTRHRALTMDQLLAIRDYRGEDFLERWRDVFMLMFYLRGINVKDLFVNAEVKDGRVLYRRSKTGEYFDIRIESEAQAILDRYSGSTQGHLLNIMDEYTDYRSFGHAVNEGLKKIGAVRVVPGRGRKLERTPIEPDLSTYWSRHTWATMAMKARVRKEAIAASLGHSWATVTDIYIAYDNEWLDDANRRVLDYVAAGGVLPDDAATSRL